MKPLRGIAAEYYFAAEAAMRGYIPLLTTRNTKGFDVVVINPATKKSVSIQIKANSENTDYWFVGKSTAEYLYTLVILSKDSQPIFYFVPPSVVDEKKKFDTTKRGTVSEYRYLSEEDISNYRQKWELLERSLS